MTGDILIYLCRWSPLFVWLAVRYYECKELSASVSKHQRVGMIESETLFHVEEVRAQVIRD